MVAKLARMTEGLYATLPDGFPLRPVWDRMVLDFGPPPLGMPKECEFIWPSTKKDA